jgi:ABC-type Fe2+-enterobactin transport system substrate-binding protein
MGTTTAAMWDVLAKAANLAQMSGLHAVMLVAVGVTLLRIPQSKRECAELERCARRLHTLLQWPTTGGEIALLRSLEMGDTVSKALGDATHLIDSYKKSTLWCRVRRGRSMARQLRDMQDVVNSYCGLVLYINAHLLIVQATTQPASDTTKYVRQITSIYPSSHTP